MIVKGEPILTLGRTDTIANPRVIIEVLSKSTEDYNRGDQFKYYRSIESFEEYILIDQYCYYVEQFHKQTDHWVFRDYQGRDAVLTLRSIDFQIPLIDLYSRVTFEAERG
jgi:Uma2 family endonuclease